MYDDCPELVNEVYKLQNWRQYRSSPDAFHECASLYPNTVDVPQNIWGYQQPLTGEGYVGLYTMQLPWTDAHEMIGCKLISPLEIGERYKVSMNICLADNQNVDIATNGIGIKFLDYDGEQFNPPINNYVHVSSDSIHADTGLWYNLTAVFIPDTAFEYICIGNFMSDVNCDTAITNSGIGVSYYLIDDVSVQKEIGLSLAKNDKKITRIYPNPSSTMFQINSSEPIRSLNLLTLEGNDLSHYLELVDYSVQIDRTEVAAGVYFLRIVLENGSIQTLKLIISD